MKPLCSVAWVALLLQSMAATAEETKSESAPKTVPVLLEQLVHKQSTKRREAAEDLGKQGAAAEGALKDLNRTLQDESPEVRVATALAMWRIERKPERVVPVLIAILKLPEKEVEVRQAACVALGEIGPAANAAAPLLFRETFKQFKGGIINYAVSASDRALNTIVSSRVPLFLDAFTWDSLPTNEPGPQELRPEVPREVVQNVVANRFALLGPKIIPELLPALKDKNPMVRQGAALTLARLREGAVNERKIIADKCTPALQLALRDVDALVRVHAAFALFLIAREPTETVPVLAAALSDKNSVVRRQAAEALQKIGPQAQLAIPSLIAALADTENFSAAEALGAIGDSALPAVITAMNNKNPKVREAATVAVAQSHCDRSTAVPALQIALKDEVRKVRSGAAKAIANIGPDAAAARIELVVAMRENRIELSEAAVALGRLGSNARDSAPALLQAMQREDSTNSLPEIAAALWQLDRETATAGVQLLAEGLREEEGRYQRLAALRELKELAAPAVPQLAKLLIVELPKEQQNLPIFVMRVLKGLGPQAKEAVPALSALVASDRNEYLRAEAARTLGTLGPVAESAKSVLRAAALDEKHPNVRKAAELALKKIAP